MSRAECSVVVAQPAVRARVRVRVRVREAADGDIAAIAAAVHALLVELGGSPPSLAALRETARVLLRDPDAGTLLIAEVDGALVGVLAASWPLALHARGRYALIQDLWVDPARRGERIGGELLSALFALARSRGIARVEVGLPREDYAGLAATAAFYRANGFGSLGVRMRRSLA
jgi:GNAT superfamily N-acetyltransferase